MKKFTQKANEGFNFREVSKVRIDKLYLLVNFAGGDADTEHPEEYEFKTIKFSEYQNHLDEINKKIEVYKTLKRILNNDNNPDYKEIKLEYGEDVARALDNAPNDPQADYQFKCYIDNIQLIGYDQQGSKHEAWV